MWLRVAMHVLGHKARTMLSSNTRLGFIAEVARNMAAGMSK